MNDQDETLTRFAARHRLRAAACLIQILNDEDASASARVSASERILAYSDGRPGTSKRVTRADILAMDKVERLELWQWLFDIEGDLPPFIVEQVEQVVQREAARLSPGRANQFTRMAPPPSEAGAAMPPHVMPRRQVAATLAAARQGPNLGSDGMPHSSPPRGEAKNEPHSLAPNGAEGVPKPPSNPPGRQPPPPPLDPAPAPAAEAFTGGYDACYRPTMRFGYDPPAGTSSPAANGSIRQDIVERSARPNGSNGIAHDAAFGGFHPWLRR
jgi:hypothetical protein